MKKKNLFLFQDLVTLVGKWWKYGVIVESHNFMLNVASGLEQVMPKNQLCHVVRTNAQNSFLVDTGTSLVAPSFSEADPGLQKQKKLP